MAIAPSSNIDKGLVGAPQDAAEMNAMEGEALDLESGEEDEGPKAPYTIEEQEDGGAIITYGEEESRDISSLGFGDNLAEVLEKSYLSSISKELGSLVEDDDAGRGLSPLKGAPGSLIRS